MNKDFGHDLIMRLLIKVILPTVLTMFFLYIMIQGTESEKTEPNIYNFNPEEISSNITAVGLEEFKASINTKSDSIFLFCSNEERKCYEQLQALSSLNINIEYLNVLELTNSEKDELKNYEMFKNNLFPKLIIIKNGSIKYYSDYLNTEELSKII